MYTHYWKRNLFVIFLSQFLAMVGFGCCMPFIPLLLKTTCILTMSSSAGSTYLSIPWPDSSA